MVMTFLPRESRVGVAAMVREPLNPGPHEGGQGAQTPPKYHYSTAGYGVHLKVQGRCVLYTL